MAVLGASDRGAAPLRRGYASQVIRVMPLVVTVTGTGTSVNAGEVVPWAEDGVRIAKASQHDLTANNVAGIVMLDPSQPDRDEWFNGETAPVLVSGTIVPYATRAAVLVGRKALFIDADDGARPRGAAAGGHVEVPRSWWNGIVANGALGEVTIDLPWGNF